MLSLIIFIPSPYCQGIMYGVYDTGPWLGIKMRGNDFVGWIGGGQHTFNLMVTF